MGFNKKVLSQAKANLNSAKAPARKKDIIVDPAGQWKHPGQNTRIPSSNITMQGVPYPVYAQPNVGQPQMMYPGQDYTFPGADYVDEYPQMRKGGEKKYSRSLEAKNILFTQNPYVKKKKKKNKKIFNPNAKYYQDGGELPDDYQEFLDYSATAPENRQPGPDYFYGNPDDYDHYGMWDALGKPKNFEEALQMNPDWTPDEYDDMYHGFSVNPNTGVFLKAGKPGGIKEGDTTWMEIAGHYLSPRAQVDTPVFDIDLQRFKYIPNKQNGGSKLGPIPLNSGRKTLRDWTYGKTIGMLQEQDGGESNYIELELTPEEIEEYRKGGYVVEDISVPSLTRFTKGGSKKKKKNVKKEPEEDFKFDSNTQLYKMSNDPSRAYAKSGSGKWYEYKAYDVGTSEDGKRITQGYFTPIDSSYDVEKNLVPNLSAMSEEEKLGIKAGVNQLPAVNIKAKKWNLFDKINQKLENYYEKRLPQQYIDEAKRGVGTGLYDSYLGQLKDFYDIHTEHLAQLEPEIAYRERYIMDPTFDNEVNTYEDMYAELGRGKRKSIEELAKENGYSDVNLFKKNLETLRKGDRQKYFDYLMKLTPGYKTPTQRQQAHSRDPRNQVQSAQSADWLWTAGVLGGASLGAEGLAGVASGLSDIGSGFMDALGYEFAPGISANTALTAGSLYDVGDKYFIQGESIFDQSPTEILYDVGSLLGPFSKYLNPTVQAAQSSIGIEKELTKGLSGENTDVIDDIKTARAVSKLPAVKIKQMGGPIELELTPEEIKEYRKQGYIVEEY